MGLNVEDVCEDWAGLRITTRRSKNDQDEAGQEIAIPHGPHLEPTAALKAWLAAVGITSGPVFRSINCMAR